MMFSGTQYELRLCFEETGLLPTSFCDALNACTRLETSSYRSVCGYEGTSEVSGSRDAADFPHSI